jgi:hypothetical protein
MKGFEGMPQEKPSGDATRDALLRIQHKIAKAETLQDKREAFIAAYESVKHLLEGLGLETRDNLQDLARSSVGSCLVRAEDPERVLGLLMGYDVEIGSRIKGRDVYANASQGVEGALPHLIADAIKISHRDLPNYAMVIGIRSDADDIEIQKLPAPSDAVEKTFYKHAKGAAHPEDIRFIAVSMPVESVPELERNEREEELFDEGKTKVPTYRYFAFPKGIPAVEKKAAA